MILLTRWKNLVFKLRNIRYKNSISLKAALIIFPSFRRRYNFPDSPTPVMVALKLLFPILKGNSLFNPYRFSKYSISISFKSPSPSLLYQNSNFSNSLFSTLSILCSVPVSKAIGQRTVYRFTRV